MPIQETFDAVSPELSQYLNRKWNGGKDTQAMRWMRELNDCMYRCQRAGVTYGLGSWGYTVLRTAYSDESDALWPTAMEKLKRWVTQYIVHLNRLISDKPDPSANEELARRFILEVLDDADTVSEVKKLNLPDDLAEASQEDIRSLNRIFDRWAPKSTIRGGDDNDDNDDNDDDDDDDVDRFRRAENPRFCDFLVIDEAALRSLAALPDETPPLHIVPRDERRARMPLYEDAYVWLVDSQAVGHFDGVEHAPAVDEGHNWIVCYRGWLKLEATNVDYAWFERLFKSDKDEWLFRLTRMPEGLGDWWYQSF